MYFINTVIEGKEFISKEVTEQSTGIFILMHVNGMISTFRSSEYETYTIVMIQIIPTHECDSHKSFITSTNDILFRLWESSPIFKIR
jgi:hypothetical protein